MNPPGLSRHKSGHWIAAPKPLLPHSSDADALLVPLTRGAVAIIDRSDAAIVEDRCWCLAKDGYVVGRNEMLHRVLWLSWGLPLPRYLDHINGDRLDCRRSNLRPASADENAWNKSKPATNTSGFKGVSWHRKVGKWQAAITARGRYKYLGLFDTAEAAHVVYCAAARELHGEFARTA